ncbi:hypothetical protein J2X69_001034 [Algoriphagus sp. 4150]|uniref:DUF6577 family protein n=1 Tax=Algoriphagus sp. 4150 TaxID=2817756 RepID=UPI0028649329|nr:DUF6577 family protein [Algoriphagus sp. 4150]MDR7128702.1 hypothetical protein [Algoriphagus sp. 4150]
MEFYKTLEPDVKKTTVNWRIYTLVQKGILSRVGRGRFSLGKGEVYTPELSSKLNSVYKKIKIDFPFLSICIWSTSALNEFMLHQPGKYYQLIEVDKDAVESIFFYLKERSYSVFLEPSEQLIRHYMIDEMEPWVVKSLVSEAPIQKVNGIPTVTIEKLLVDIFCDPVIFNAQQGSEMNQIFNEAFEKYTISESKMLRYASRRRRKEELDKYLSEVSIYRQQIKYAADNLK